jgi:hypothetical protein
MLDKRLAGLAAVLALITGGCGSSGNTTGTIHGRTFDSTKAIAAVLYEESFDLYRCSEPAPTAVSESGVQCFHVAPNGVEEAVALNIYASDDQEDHAREDLSGGGEWADTFWGNRWSVSSQSRATAAEVREAIAAAADDRL